jgi:predicted metal-dependent phosphoesterase TrpH
MLQIRADFHTHSIGESSFGPRSEELIARHLEAAVEVGLDCLTVSDHNDLRPGLLAREYAARRQLPLLVVPGMELTTQERVHLLAVGLEDAVDAWQPLTDTIARIRDVGAISVLPHPFYAHLRSRTDVDAIERFNAQYGDFDLNGSRVPLVGDSDAHSADDLRASAHYTLVEVSERSWEAIADAIRAGRTTPI